MPDVKRPAATFNPDNPEGRLKQQIQVRIARTERNVRSEDRKCQSIASQRDGVVAALP